MKEDKWYVVNFNEGGYLSYDEGPAVLSENEARELAARWNAKAIADLPTEQGGQMAAGKGFEAISTAMVDSVLGHYPTFSVESDECRNEYLEFFISIYPLFRRQSETNNISLEEDN